MNAQMGGLLPSEKVVTINLSTWEYKMNQYVVDQGYWRYIDDTLENKPDITNANYLTWEGKMFFKKSEG